MAASIQKCIECGMTTSGSNHHCFGDWWDISESVMSPPPRNKPCEKIKKKSVVTVRSNRKKIKKKRTRRSKPIKS